MSTTLSPDIKELEDRLEDDEECHLFCCDENKAFCGVDLSGYVAIPAMEMPEENVCMFCIKIAQLWGAPCCGGRVPRA